MIRARAFACGLLLFGGWVQLLVVRCATPPVEPPAEPRYQTRSPADVDGIGKVYLGREIAQVMGHAGLDWLERPEREQEERPDLLIPLLDLKPGAVVADLGAGSGYYTRRLARAVAPTGLVYAVDIQPEMLAELDRRMRSEGLTNYVGRLGTITDPKLPTDALDLVLLVDVYHELSHPYEVIEAICRALKRGGKLVLVEFRGEDPQVPIKRLHKMTEHQAKREMAEHPLEWVGTRTNLPWQHVIVFRRR